MKEIWKDIKGFGRDYQISNKGNVRSFKNGGDKILKSNKEKNGYLQIRLTKKGVQKTYKIHRIVMAEFIGKNSLDVNHKNGIKSDNRLENLEYCTKSYNSKHRFEVLGHVSPNKGKFGSSSPSSKKISQFTKNGVHLRNWGSIIEASENLGIHAGDIGQVCRLKLKSAGGYVWKYLY